MSNDIEELRELIENCEDEAQLEELYAQLEWLLTEQEMRQG